MYVHHALAYQASYPCEVGKLVYIGDKSGNNAIAVVEVSLVAACTGKIVLVALVTRIEPTVLTAHYR